MAKKTRKKSGGRTKGTKNKKTERWEYIRDSMEPTMAIAYGVNDPNKAIAMWMNESQENKDWYMKSAIQTMNEQKITRERDDREMEVERIRAAALVQGEQTGGSAVTNIFTGNLPVDDAQALEQAEPLNVIDVEEKQLAELPSPKESDDCLD